mgnify:CR=1 FL=1
MNRIFVLFEKIVFKKKYPCEQNYSCYSIFVFKILLVV